MSKINPEYVEFLEERVRQLTAALAGTDNPISLPSGVILTPRQEQVLTMIVARGSETATREMIYQTLYGDRPDAPTMKSVDVLVSKLRQRLGETYPFIETVYRKGYKANPRFLPFLTGDKPWENRT